MTEMEIWICIYSITPVQEYAGFSRFLKSYKTRSNPAYGDKLYQNNLIAAEKESFGRFTDVTQKAGIKNNVLGFGLGCSSRRFE